MGDLISRETAVAILRAKADITIGKVKDAASFFNYCANMIEKLPAVDAAPVRHGEWISRSYACGETKWEYSACGEADWRGNTDWMFCPHCGAKLDGGEKK